MKLSLSWIFDHIATSWKDHDIAALINQFNNTTAEIEGYEFITTDLSAFTLVKIDAIQEDTIVGISDELRETIQLPLRPDAQRGMFFLIKKNKKTWHWAQGQDFFSAKEGFLPNLWVAQADCAGLWKNNFEKEDYSITIKNTSITHRPDLWCHRGVARECAALLECQLLDEKHFLTDYPVTYCNEFEYSLAKNSFVLERQTEKCKRVAALYLSHITPFPSLLPIAHRLLRVDSRAINGIVDITNYSMFDIGQPMHAFDTAKLGGKKIFIKLAKGDQKLVLLDGQEITVTNDNVVIDNGSKPVSLAGIMGGLESSVDNTTQSIIIESANFEASSIRRTAQQHKLRTESSTRFEKSLDPLQVVAALLRFLHLLDTYKISYTCQGEIICLGKDIPTGTVEVAHDFIEKKLGVVVAQEFITHTLERLGFDVTVRTEKPLLYSIKVPSWRGTKDPVIREDIVEEVGRYFGYDNIPAQLPALVMKPCPDVQFQKKYMIKQNLALLASAYEVYNYALYDEEFLKIIHWVPEQTLQIKNYISEHMIRLVTSLIPNLFKTIYNNRAQDTILNFFEWNKVWPCSKQPSNSDVQEQSSLAGIFYNEKKSVDFYEKKDQLSMLLKIMGIDVVWQKADHTNLAPWYHPYKTALLYYKSHYIGTAGSVNPGFIAEFLPGDAFIFELNGDALLSSNPEQVIFEPLPKYQDTWRDISMLIPLNLTVQQLCDAIIKTSSTIFHVALVDFFQKEEWHDKRSVTVRFFARDADKTLSTEDIDQIYEQVVKILVPLGVEIR